MPTHIHSAIKAGVASILLCLQAACTTPPAIEDAPLAQRYWPQPPAQPRYLHETSLRYMEDIQPPSNEDRLRSALLGKPAKHIAFRRPYDVAANFGRIYVSDVESGLISVFDVPRRRFHVIGSRAQGRLIKPMGLALDAESNLYVADAGARRVQVFDFLGMHLRSIGENEALQQPVSVAVNRTNGTVYVVDHGGIDSDKHRVLMYDKSGRLLRSIGSRGEAAGQFNLPTDAAIGRDGTLYVLDAGNFRVQMFDSSGEFLGQWGALGKGFGQFARPRSITIDDQDNLYITDMFFGNFQVFNSRGELLLPVGTINETNGPGKFRLISGIGVDETQRIYVTDQLFRKVEVFRLLSDAESRGLLEQWAEQQ